MKKSSQRILTTLAIGALASAGISTALAQSQSSGKPTVMSPPAVNNGSNWSRAPFPAQRLFDDVKAPDGAAIDNLPPNTPATNVEPPPPPARVAIMQPTPAPTVTATDPGLLPTGRSTVAVATTLDATTFAPSLRAAPHSSRDTIIADVETRLAASESAVASVRSSSSQMSAAGRQSFNAASDDAKDKAKALRKSLDKARKAGPTEWESARAQLAADFDAYASSLAHIDAMAR